VRDRHHKAETRRRPKGYGAGAGSPAKRASRARPAKAGHARNFDPGHRLSQQPHRPSRQRSHAVLPLLYRAQPHRNRRPLPSHAAQPPDRMAELHVGMMPEHEPDRLQDFALAAGDLDPARHERREARAARIFRWRDVIRVCAHRFPIARRTEQNKNVSMPALKEPVPTTRQHFAAPSLAS
jgi:hypothetical protein